MSLVLENVTYIYGEGGLEETKALHDVSLTVPDHSFVGLVGHTGSGKSTLVQLMNGLLRPSQGRVLVDGYDLADKSKEVRERRKQVGLVFQYPEYQLFEETIAKDIAFGPKNQGLSEDEQIERVKEAMALVDLDYDTWKDRSPFELSGGQKRRVAIAGIVAMRPRYLILDEPTASLTEQETSVLLDIIRDLQQHGIACIYISHKLNEVKAISDTICVIRDGQHIGTRDAAGMSEDDIITMMVGRELTALYPNEPHTTGDEILRIEHLTAWHPVNRHIKRVNDVSFSLKRGEILGIAGLVGAGRTETIQCLFGVWPGQWEGKIYIDGKQVDIRNCQQAIAQGIAMVPEDRKRDGIVPVMAVGKNITLAALNKFTGGISQLDDAAEQKCILESIQQLKVKTSSSDLAIGRLSGGNQQKAILARCLLLNPRILILDEPTSSLASAEVELVISAVKKMSALGVAVIYVSHRMEEIRRIASCATVMRDGQVAGDVMLENTSTHHIVSLMLGRDHVDIAPVAPQEIMDQAVLEVRALRHKPKLEDISFTLRRGEVLGIAGLLGAGRSELLKAIVGLETYEQGEIVINGEKITRPDYDDMLKRGIGYTPENRKEAGIIPWLGVDENTVLTNRQKISANGVLQWSTIRRLTEEVMQRMTVKAASSETPIGTLSGGNQQKVVIGRWVYAASQILLLDEPTRGVDIEAKQQIYRIVRELAAEGKSVVFISSEVEELPLVCDRILLLQHGTFSQEFHSPVNVDELMSAILSVH